MKSEGFPCKVDTCSAVSRTRAYLVGERDGWVDGFKSCGRSSTLLRGQLGYLFDQESARRTRVIAMLSVWAHILLSSVLGAGAVSAERDPWRTKVKV